MKISSKEELLKRFRNDPDVIDVLKRATDETEKAKALRTVEFFLSSMFEAVIPVLSQMKQDPDAARQISEALKSGEGIIKESDGSPINSGSKG